MTDDHITLRGSFPQGPLCVHKSKVLSGASHRFAGANVAGCHSCYPRAQAPHPPLPPGGSDTDHCGQDGSDRNIWVTTVFLPLLPICPEFKRRNSRRKEGGWASEERKSLRPKGAHSRWGLQATTHSKALMISWLGGPVHSNILETLPGSAEGGLSSTHHR